MPKQEKVQLTIYLPQKIRAELQKLAAKRMLEYPQKNFSAASIAVEIIIKYLSQVAIEIDQGERKNEK